MLLSGLIFCRVQHIAQQRTIHDAWRIPLKPRTLGLDVGYCEDDHTIWNACWGAEGYWGTLYAAICVDGFHHIGVDRIWHELIIHCSPF